MKRYAVNENGILTIRELVLMPLLKDDEAENKARKKANKAAAKVYSDLIKNGDAVELTTELEHELRHYDIKGGKLVYNADREKEERNRAIREKRAREYPPIGDALDALAKWAFTEKEIGLPDDLKSWAAKCMSVKAQNPIED